jgi:restriction system protein
VGAVWSSNFEFASEFSELVGYKAGLALTRRELHEHLADCPYYNGFLRRKTYCMMRIRSEEVEQLTGWLLWRVGYLGQLPEPGVGIGLYHKYKQDPALLRKFMSILARLTPFLEGAMDRLKTSDRLIDPTPFLTAARKKHGPGGGLIACELLSSLDCYMRANPWSRVRSIEWKDTAELRKLFDSERLKTKHGRFLDQRFIDYLAANFGAIDRMNWRKFEGLVAEYFTRIGYEVEIGPGRNDNGVDIRLWRGVPDRPGAPPLMLVQCKRQRSKIEKVVVKALWADIQHERAKSGLIVTTSLLSPGAAAVANARSYPVDAADRTQLRTWVEQLRSPGSGVVLGA